MLRIYLLLFVFGCTKLLYTQNYDYIWLLGQDSQSDLEHAGIVLDFFDDTLIVYSEFRDTYFRQVNASICDNSGSVLFSTNGLKIYDSAGITMTNGDGLNPGALADEWIGVGYSLHQGALSLPFPEKQNEYILFHKDLERNLNLFRIETHHFYYSLIDVGNSSETSEVKEKNFPLLDELLATGKITAVQHANGRDWWIPVRRYSSNEYYMFLLSHEGVENTGIQVIGDSIPSGSLGQAVFSPDGTKYVQTNLHGSQGDPIYINIYDFDRCSGELYNPIQFTYADSAVCLGAA
ncbi:MAG: hypothetical protein AAGJ93_16470, partial [Bacteroidota bacterium]